jgi:transposase
VIPDDLSLRPLAVQHFPLVREALRRLGILDVLDALFPKDPRSDVSDADCVSVMVMNLLQGRVALYRMDEWLVHYDVEVLLGEGVRPASFNDTRLGGCLDHLFDAGTDYVLSAVARHYLHRDSAPRRYTVHGDTTSLALQGAYDVIPDEGAPSAMHGFSKDHRPDLKQVIFGLSLYGPTGMPLTASVLDGNSSDQQTNRLCIEQLASLLRPDDEVTLVGDCKLVDATTLGQLLDEDFHFISLLPDNYNLRQQLIRTALADTAPMPELAREPGRTKKDPPHIYQGRSYETTFPLQDPHTPGKEGLSTKRMRGLVVESPQLRAKFEAGLESLLEREVKRVHTTLRRANQEPFRCQSDAAAARESVLATLSLHQATIAVERREKTLPRARRGRPKKGEEPSVEVFYTLALQELVPDEAAVEAARREASHFVLLTDHLDKDVWSDVAVLREYRQQHLIEGHSGFRWFKSTAQVSPLFLKTPRRIQALCLVFVLALMVRNYLQFEVRRQMAEQKLALPYYDRRRETELPTAELLFDLFAGAQVVQIIRDEVVQQRRLGKMDPGAKTVLTLLNLDEALFTTVRPKSRSDQEEIPRM